TERAGAAGAAAHRERCAVLRHVGFVQSSGCAKEGDRDVRAGGLRGEHDDRERFIARGADDTALENGASGRANSLAGAFAEPGGGGSETGERTAAGIFPE